MHGRSTSLARVAATLWLPFALACAMEPAGPGGNTDVDDLDVTVPAAVTMDLPLTGLTASGGHTCAVAWTGRAYCWGANTYGELGDSTAIASRVPVAVRTAARFVSVSADGFIRWPEYGVEPHPWAAYTCALDGTGTAHCWGDMTYGQLGTGVLPCPDCRWPETLTPQPVLGGPYAQLSAGDRHACAITAAGAVYCWGDRSGAGGSWNRPSLVADPGGSAVHVTAGGDHTCVLTSRGEAFCWGSNRWGQIGSGVAGLSERQLVPTRVSLSNLTALAAADNGTCALTHEGKAWCWGRNDAGQLGDGSVRPVCRADNNTFICPTDPAGPREVATAVRFNAITVGQFHTCALDADGRAYCWGAAAQVGRRTGDLAVPGEVETELRFREIVAGASHTCALSLQGLAYCWGEGRFGQLGNGSRRNVLLPTAIAHRPD
jgi:alpha-tubulin suppressor-like RCC1 family protein